MMRNAPRWKIVVSSAVLASTAFGAYPPNYSPTIADLKAIYQPPGSVQGIICSPTAYSDPDQRSICKDGVEAARWMAEAYALKAGSYLGCLDGLHQGLRLGFDAGQADPNGEFAKQAAAEFAGATFTSALNRAAEEATAKGQTASADEIIKRYRAVIGKRDAAGRPVLPNKTPSELKFDFTGFDDGYDYDVTSQMSDFDNVYAAGWVNKQSPWAERMQARSLYTSSSDYASSLCNQDGTVFGRRGMPALSIWDIFRQREKFIFENYAWNNADWAWEILTKHENRLAEYVTFVEIENKTKVVTREIDVMETQIKLDANGKAIQKKNADGSPMVDARGVPVYETVEVKVGKREVKETIPLPEAEKQALRQAYRTGFYESYSRHYARQYASINYHTTGQNMFNTGQAIGKLMGREVARENARKRAYDTAYKVASVGEYKRLVEKNYLTSFNYLINIFATNPVMELNDAMVMGQFDDGIFRAGEDLGIQFSATNLGEVSRPSTFSILQSDNVIPAASGYTFSIPALSSGNFVSSVLGTVAPNVKARNTLNVNFGLTNPGDLKEVARSLVVQKNQPIAINDYLEIERVNTVLDYLTGKMTAVVDVMNPAKSTAPLIASKVDLNLGANGVKESNVLQIAGGGVSKIAIEIGSIDPLSIINARTIGGSVNTYVGSRVAHSVGVSASIPSGDVHADATWSALINYFDALATGKSMNTGSQPRANRLADLMSTIARQVKREVDANNIKWHNTSERERKDMQGTIIASLQRAHSRSASAGLMNANAQAVYNQLGKILMGYKNDVKAAGGMNRGKNRDAYADHVKKFARI